MHGLDVAHEVIEARQDEHARIGEGRALAGGQERISMHLQLVG